MSRIKEIRRQLEAAAEAIETLDADLAAGRVAGEEHARRRAERERETGRLYLSLRTAQREGAAPGAHGPAPAQRRPAAWWRGPAAVGTAAVVLVVLGVGAGLLLGRRPAEAPGRGAGAGTSAPGSGPGLPAMMSDVALQALRAVAAREDAPIPSLLELAHAALDQGRLDEARQVYERVLGRDPKNVEAINHMGGVLFQEGRVDEALAKVEEALRLDPRYIHALWDRTQYLFHAKRDFAGAVKAAQAFLDVVPQGPDADTVRRLLAEAQQQAPRTAPPAARGR
jgi:tetratricopeptide (TPR) repeat protein